jgi:hypothetical protein
MRNRATKLLAATLGIGLAGFTLPAVSDTLQEQDKALQDPDKDCVAAPDGPAAQGAHWYYRIDRATKRHCWYVRDDAQAVALLAPSSAKPVAAPANTTLQPSVADARAEVSPAPETVRSTTTVANIASNDGATNGEETLSAQSRAVVDASPNQPGAELSAEGAPSNVATGVRQQIQPASVRQVGGRVARPLWMLLSALAGALALAGIASGAIAKFGRSRAIRRQNSHNKRGRDRTIWSAPANENRAASQQVSEDMSWQDESLDQAPMDWIRIARETQEASRRGEQIEQLLASVKRRSAV